MLLIFFLEKKKSKSCESWSNMIQLTLQIQKQPRGPVKTVWLKKFNMISFFNIKIRTYCIDLGQYRLTCQIRNSGYEIMITS